ncbi:ATP-binding cassette domain-containing protein [Aeromicrobium sp. UC242_57]|uniref:ATP-binding cassette domain-containing protein n=1 Tax=Aeromicrobium sp. UC242_57 TaxID=3374624 RepID=UPI0037A1B87D
MQIAAGVLRPDAGEVSVGGLDPYRGAERRDALGMVAFVPQEFDFPRRYTLQEFLFYMGWMRGVARLARRQRVLDAVESVNLGDRLGSRLSALSGGMLRRAAVAQALLARPKVLLLDEPTAGLDPVQRSEIVELVGRLGRDTSVLFREPHH